MYNRTFETYKAPSYVYVKKKKLQNIVFVRISYILCMYKRNNLNFG